MFVTLLATPQARPDSRRLPASVVPGQGFRISGQGPFLARNIAEPREILAYGLVDLPDRASLNRELARVAQQEAVRHERIASVIESTTARGIFELTDTFDFSTDEPVARGRPRWLGNRV